MAKHFVLEQPKSGKFAAQINELLRVIEGFNDITMDEKIIIDFRKINFVHPVFIIILAALISKYRENGYEIDIISI